MAILNITCVHPIVARPDRKGPSFRKVDSLKEYGMKYNWGTDYYRSYEKIEHTEAVWFKMLKVIARLGDKATAANIRKEMGWGSNANRSHCDYFSTLRAKGEIDWHIKKVDGRKKPVYYLTNQGKSTLDYANSKLPTAIANAEKRGTQRMTRDEFVQKLKKLQAAALKRQIIEEAK